MPWSSQHMQWLVDTGQNLTTTDDKVISVFEFQHQEDEAILATWAKHFRNHYCLDSEIDSLREGTSYSRSEYLLNLKFPTQTDAPGPSIRAGDFAEILVADYLEYQAGYWVPRTRYGNKTVRNESVKGCDTIGFKIAQDGIFSPTDRLVIYETKAQFSGETAKPRLRDAIDDSGKDITRKAESLNAIKQRLKDQNKISEAKKVQRFQNKEDNPYMESFGAVAFFDNNVFDTETITSTSSSEHPQASSLTLIVIKGEQMMPLVHKIYNKAANEA